MGKPPYGGPESFTHGRFPQNPQPKPSQDEPRLREVLTQSFFVVTSLMRLPSMVHNTETQAERRHPDLFGLLFGRFG